MFKRVNIATFVTFLACLFAISTVVLGGCPSAEADDDDSSVADDDDSSVNDDDDSAADDDDSAGDDDDSAE
jgi:hypothetical protein